MQLPIAVNVGCGEIRKTLSSVYLRACARWLTRILSRTPPMLLKQLLRIISLIEWLLINSTLNLIRLLTFLPLCLVSISLSLSSALYFTLCWFRIHSPFARTKLPIIQLPASYVFFSLSVSRSFWLMSSSSKLTSCLLVVYSSVAYHMG